MSDNECFSVEEYVNTFHTVFFLTVDGNLDNKNVAKMRKFYTSFTHLIQSGGGIAVPSVAEATPLQLFVSAYAAYYSFNRNMKWTGTFEFKATP